MSNMESHENFNKIMEVMAIQNHSYAQFTAM
jgi:hypothetical protein